MAKAKTKKSEQDNALKLWGGRFKKPLDPLVLQYTTSVHMDFPLARYDVIGSMAHAQMLGETGIIKSSEAAQLVKGLKVLLKRIDADEWEPDPSAEDVHSQVQEALEAEVGDVARKIHTARSRNDQVALDLRLYCRDAVVAIVQALEFVQGALVDLGDKNIDVIIAGYTHLQRAQPVHLAHHLLAYVEMLERDKERFLDAYKRINVMPLGSGALAGSSLPIDRKFVAEALEFDGICQNSMDAVSDRDFAVEVVSGLSLLAIHLSRLAEDLILWAGEEFSLLKLDDAYATGSSLMPQKKNPDVLEILRGQSGVVIGNLMGFLTMLKGLPMTYNRDLQWDKRFVFESIEQSLESLVVLSQLLENSSINVSAADRLLASDAVCATDLAEYLVEQGVAFREAHGFVGNIVAMAEQKGIQLSDLTLEQMQSVTPAIEKDVYKVLDPKNTVKRKKSLGSTQTAGVKRAIASWKKRLK